MCILILLLSICSCHGSYYGLGSEKNYISETERTIEQSELSNLGCFICTQLLSVTKHRVGLSQNQLKNVLLEKCRLLSVFKKQCTTFVEASLPEIYFSLNYDFSTKDVCVRLNFCDEADSFAIGGPSIKDLITTNTKLPSSESSTAKDKSKKTGQKYAELAEKEEEKRMTCAFCERMLENAKNYAITSKTHITAFANSACMKLPKGRFSEQCYQLADKRIAELAKFVDQQVIEALWCAELNQC